MDPEHGDSFTLLLDLHEPSCAACYRASDEKGRTDPRYRADFGALVEDIVRWVVADAGIGLAYLIYDGQAPFEAATLAASDLTAQGAWFVLPKTHALVRQVPGDAFCEGYVMYDWDAEYFACGG